MTEEQFKLACRVVFIVCYFVWADGDWTIWTNIWKNIAKYDSNYQRAYVWKPNGDIIFCNTMGDLIKALYKVKSAYIDDYCKCYEKNM